MGSVGKTSINTTTMSSAPVPVITPVNQGQDVQNQTPNAQNTPVTPNALQALQNMSDSQLAALVMASKNAQLPNFLNDVADQTQRFVFQAGLNEKPMVLDSTSFNQFMQDNGISQGEILSRSVNPVQYTNQDNTKISLSGQQIIQIMQDSRFNYIGGKRGGQVYGAGTYFDMNGGRNTGYGGTTVNAVLNPATTRAIDESTLYKQAATWAQSHPQSARAIGRINNSNQSIYALAMGYNVITEYDPKYKSGYHNVIDRSALVYKK